MRLFLCDYVTAEIIDNFLTNPYLSVRQEKSAGQANQRGQGRGEVMICLAFSLLLSFEQCKRK